MEPAVLDLLRRVPKVRNMNIDGFRLPDAVKSPNTLLKQIRVCGQIKQHQMVRKLEVATFAANLGTNQCLSALFVVSKVGGGSVMLQKAQALDRKSTRLNSSHVRISYAV